MTDEEDNASQTLVDKLIAALLGLPWVDVLDDALDGLLKEIQGRSYKGLYEVLEYESRLELKDREGKTVTFKRRERVPYVQDNVTAYQDYTRRDGETLLNLRCKHHASGTTAGRQPVLRDGNECIGHRESPPVPCRDY